MIHTYENVQVCHDKISDMEERMGETFVRCHQSFLVNIKHVRRLNKTSMTLDNGYELPVARAKFKEVSSRLAKYEGML